MKKLLPVAFAALILTGCGAAPSATMPAQSAAGFEAAGKRQSPAPKQGLFDKLTGMVSLHEHWEKPYVDFEFATQGLIFSDAVRKQPYITLNGQDYDADGYTMIAGDDGVLYCGSLENKDKKFYVLGTWEKPATMKVGMFRQKVAIKLVEHTFTVKRPLNPMSHITFKLDVKAPLKSVDKAPQRVYVNK